MYETLKYINAVWGIISLLLLLIVVVNVTVGYNGNRTFGAKDKKLSLFALIAAHIQFLIGIVLYVNSPLGLAVLGQMKDASLRLTSLEHPLVALIAIVLITIGWSKHKKQYDSKKQFKTFAIFYGIALLFILSRLPWALLMDFIRSF